MNTLQGVFIVSGICLVIANGCSVSGDSQTSPVSPRSDSTGAGSGNVSSSPPSDEPKYSDTSEHHPAVVTQDESRQPEPSTPASSAETVIQGASPNPRVVCERMVSRATLVLLAGGKPHNVNIGEEGIAVVVRPPGVPESVRLNISGGAGVFVSADGFFLTVEHMARQEPMYACYIDNAGAARCDLVVFHQVLEYSVEGEALVLGKVEAEVTPIAVATEASAGEPCLAVGAGFRGSKFAWGQLTAVRSPTVSDLRSETPYAWAKVYHSSAIRPGDSGGPLVNERAELIGVNCAMMGDTSGKVWALAIRVSRSKLEDILGDITNLLNNRVTTPP